MLTLTVELHPRCWPTDWISFRTEWPDCNLFVVLYCLTKKPRRSSNLTKNSHYEAHSSWRARCAALNSIMSIFHWIDVSEEWRATKFIIFPPQSKPPHSISKWYHQSRWNASQNVTSNRSLRPTNFFVCFRRCRGNPLVGILLQKSDCFKRRHSWWVNCCVRIWLSKARTALTGYEGVVLWLHPLGRVSDIVDFAFDVSGTSPSEYPLSAGDLDNAAKIKTQPFYTISNGCKN